MGITFFMIILVFSGSDQTLTTSFLKVFTALSDGSSKISQNFGCQNASYIVPQGKAARLAFQSAHGTPMHRYWLVTMVCIYSRVLHTLDLVSISSAMGRSEFCTSGLYQGVFILREAYALSQHLPPPKLRGHTCKTYHMVFMCTIKVLLWDFYIALK